MKLTCSYCGTQYPDVYRSATCRLCGHELTDSKAEAHYDYMTWYLTQLWYAWRRELDCAAPRILKEEDWWDICSYFNGCAVCGQESIDTKAFLVPPMLGGKMYTYNVYPICDECQSALIKNRTDNPFTDFYRTFGKDFIGAFYRILGALMAKMYDKSLVDIDPDVDTIEIIVRCTENTSIKPFDGVYAARIHEVPLTPRVGRMDQASFLPDREDAAGITWRLLDESESPRDFPQVCYRPYKPLKVPGQEGGVHHL